MNLLRPAMMTYKNDVLEVSAETCLNRTLKAVLFLFQFQDTGAELGQHAGLRSHFQRDTPTGNGSGSGHLGAVGERSQNSLRDDFLPLTKVRLKT